MGEKYVAAFAEGLKAGKDIRSLIIRGASLKTAGAIKTRRPLTWILCRRIKILDRHLLWDDMLI